MPEYLASLAKSIPCRACGAVRGPRAEHDNDGMEWEICANCWVALQRFTEHGPPYSDDDLNRWLARKLFLDLRRLQQKGIVGRCQAVSGWIYGRRGQQCALPAIIKLSDGHLVCGQHLQSPRHSLEFVDGHNPNGPYEILGCIIQRLVKKDKKLLDTISAAIGLDSAPFSRVKSGHGRGARAIDLMGRSFGKLMVIARCDHRVGKGRHRYWLCRCECGVEKEIRADALLNGYYLSCGCRRAQASASRVAAACRDEDGHFLPTVGLS